MAAAPTLSRLQLHYSSCCALFIKRGSIITTRTRRSNTSFNFRCCHNTTTTSATTFHINGTDEEVVAVAEYYPTTMSTSKRRELFIQLGVGLFCPSLMTAAAPSSSSSSSSVLALAAETRLAADDASQEFRLYLDNANKFKISIPPDWQVGSEEGNGIRSITAFYPPDPSVASNVSLVISGLGADFTRLESFGNVDAFAENLVGGLDRSWQRPPGVKAKLVNSKSANGLYYIDYTLQNPGESRKHLFSVLGIANNGWYNRLYTLTGQFVEEEEEKYGPTIQKAVASFRLI